MGKKRKQTKFAPDEKYVTVIDPWGTFGFTPEDEIQASINNISAWFEIMLQDRYPDINVRPRAIYYQSTHQNVIIELPEEVDITLLLGAHLTWQYMTPPECMHACLVSRVYEYNYDSGDPQHQQWSHRMPTYQRLPSDFPIRRPYPPPEKCEGPDLKWRQFAKQLPAHMKLPPGQRIQEPPHPPSPAEPDETSLSPPQDKTPELDTSAFTPYERPANMPILPPSPVKVKNEPESEEVLPKIKRDPYEEEEESKLFLRPTNECVKKEEEDPTFSGGSLFEATPSSSSSRSQTLETDATGKSGQVKAEPGMESGYDFAPLPEKSTDIFAAFFAKNKHVTNGAIIPDMVIGQSDWDQPRRQQSHGQYQSRNSSVISDAESTYARCGSFDSSSYGDSRSGSATVVVKSEYDPEMDKRGLYGSRGGSESVSSGQTPVVKSEDVDSFLSSIPASTSGQARIKLEPQEGRMPPPPSSYSYPNGRQPAPPPPYASGYTGSNGNRKSNTNGPYAPYSSSSPTRSYKPNFNVPPRAFPSSSGKQTRDPRQDPRRTSTINGTDHASNSANAGAGSRRAPSLESRDPRIRHMAMMANQASVRVKQESDA